MAKNLNVLFIMCDQLRADYLSCYGHPHLHTPNIDNLARQGVRFNQAYVQSTICGPSRMCTYTGRYARSHGSTQNGMPLKIGEQTLGDHLKKLDVHSVLVGKTHMAADLEGMQRLGIDPSSTIGVHLSECGFEPFERDDGIHPNHDGADTHYNDYLKKQGFDGKNPWMDWANSVEDTEGKLRSGWFLENAGKPARVPEQHSETAYMTQKAMQFMAEAKTGKQPWCLHLSYIKPHWPYIVPAPYHNMFSVDQLVEPIRDKTELNDPHPLLDAFQNEHYSRVFCRPGVREKVIPAYMGLIKQIDDQLGRLFEFMRRENLLDETLIVFTSDHGDYLGDHWLGEKQLFHDMSVRVPLIVVDPSKAADVTRGTVSETLVEAIDLVPTFVDYFGGDEQPHILEGRSLLPLLRGQQTEWRSHVISEYDYAFDLARINLKVSVPNARMYMVFDGRWKYIHADGFRPMLYDLHSDPEEIHDLGDQSECEEIRSQLYEVLAHWSRTTRTQTTLSDQYITARDEDWPHYDIHLDSGVMVGYWDESELEAELVKKDQLLESRSGTE
ncbi:MAG: arylsulfatase A-like enzyme [Parasphingorhabdus sp.]|jgi:arylsulfatase A-like enzyme